MEGSNSGYTLYQSGGFRNDSDFRKLAQTVGTNIQKISQNVSSLQRMVNQLGTHQDSPELRSQLQQIRNYTQQLAKDTNGSLRELSHFTQANPDKREWKAQKDRLADEFTVALNSFQSAQRDVARKGKEQIRRVKMNSGLGDPFGGGRFTDELIELQDNTDQRQSQLQEEMNIQLLEEQEQSIRELESNISDINQIFKELGAMVHEQGEVIDSIEASVEKTEVYVNEGSNQLRQASNYKSKIRRKKFVLGLCLGLILSIIIIVIVWKTS